MMLTGVKRLIKPIFYNLITLYAIVKNISFLYRENTRPKKMGEKIVILGNSPDVEMYLNKTDRFLDYDLLVVNFFPLQEGIFFGLKPRYLCLMDPIFFFKELSTNDCIKNKVLSLFAVLEKVTWGLTLIIPAGSTIHVKNPKIEFINLSRAIYMNSTTDFQARCFYKNYILPISHNVASSALMFAEIFGYNQIALIGVNLDWMKSYAVDKDNVLWLEDTHFYGSNRRVKDDSYLGQLKATFYTFWGFNEASILAQFSKIKIVNYSPNSFLQMFKKEVL